MTEFTIVCKRCGGEVKGTEGQNVVACPFCDSPNTISGSFESNANLFNRANYLRRANEFDKAAAVYEDILKHDNTDYEAHWGTALCRFGIEYVIDSETEKCVPTCHRTQYDSILSDPDYLAAVEYAPLEVRAEYEAEGAYIDKVQKGILALARRQEKYDVFLCYKETDEAGNRSEDSVLAQELEFELTKRGYKVFFARKSLQGKLGIAYEPVIFSALHSARVMVVLGTKPEHFTAVWVKNEWSRYRELIKKGEDKTLIPAYRGMSPYDLPQEFSSLQALDMGKLGFVQDLCDGIDKLTKVGKSSDAKGGEPVAPGVQSLMRRAQLFLEDGDFKSAAEYANKVLDIDPECAPAYIAKLQASLSLRSEEDLGMAATPLDKYGDYQKAVRFADSRLKAIYADYASSSAKTAADAVAATTAERIRRCSVGTVLTFGVYEHDDNIGNGKEAIQWCVLARAGTKALLISSFDLDCLPFNTEYISVTWEICTLRRWLNNTFLNTAFTKEQQKAIVETRRRNTVSGLFRKKEGNSTQDRVFLLSEAEAEQHFTGDADRIAKNTAYAKAKGAFTNDSGAGWWWLRSPGGNYQYNAAYVSYDGSLSHFGNYVNNDYGAVRPALWIDLSSL